MAVKKKGGIDPVRFGDVVVRFGRKSDGRVDVKWREDGRAQRTTRSTEALARAFAEAKAREVSGKTGRQWVAPAEAEALAALRELARGEGMSVGDLAAVVRAAATAAGGVRRIAATAEYYVSHGPGGAADVSLGDALAKVRAEYDHARGATRNTMRVALDHMVRLLPEKPLAEVGREDVELFVFEAGKSTRTARNRLTQAGTFFSRCRALGLWPRARPLPTEAVKRPRLPDTAPELFSPAQGKRLLARVRKNCPRYLPYLVIAGWCGCRPSECLKIRWEDVDLEHAVIHLSAEAVGKTARERWVPIEGTVLAFLRARKEAAAPDPTDRVCIKRSREELSKLARSMGMPWPADVLRHSAITYQLQVSGNDYNRTAERMGNSPRVIESSYRRPIPAGWGAQWFALLAGVV